MRLRSRHLLLILLVIVLVPIGVGAAIAFSRGWPESWRAAQWSSSGLLPKAGEEPRARVVVLSARAGNWRSIFAEHTAIVMKRAGDAEWSRYDVVGWGTPVRRNAYPADALWYSNRPYVVASYAGEEAEKLIGPIERAIARYPWSVRGDYLVWPGPNSNTFVAWVARQTPGFSVEMPPTAIGKDWLGWGVHLDKAPSGTGYTVSLAGLFGVTVARAEGLEINVLGTGVGVDPGDLAIKLPALGKLAL